MLTGTIILLVVSLLGTTLAPKKTVFDDYLSPKVTSPIKGVCALLVMLHHISQRLDPMESSIYQNIGFLAVAIFFFYSGYGLTVNRLTKPNYMHPFLRRRVTSMLIPFFATNILYVLAFSVIGAGNYNPLLLISQVFGKDQLNVNAWYIVALFWFYVAYWVSFRFLKSERKGWIFMAVFIWVYIVACGLWSPGVWWYNTAFCFLLGMAWATFRDKLHRLFSRGTWLWMLVPVVIVCIGVKTYIACYSTNLALTFFGSAAASLAFAWLIVLLSMKIRLSNPIVEFLGKYSFEIYLIHHLLFSVVRLPVFHLSGNMAFTLSVILSACLMALWLKPVDDWLVKKVQKLLL